MTAISQPPYLPDLAPADFFLFLNRKYPVKRQIFDTTEEMEEKSPMEFNSISEEEFFGCF